MYYILPRSVTLRTSRWLLGSSILLNLFWSALSLYLPQGLHQNIWSYQKLFLVGMESRLSPAGIVLVSGSAALFSLLMYPVTHSSLATPSRTKWYAIAWFFSFRVESGIHVLHKRDWLSPYKNEQPITGIPIILSLYHSPLTYSHHCFIATNSLPNVLHSTPFCRFENQ